MVTTKRISLVKVITKVLGIFSFTTIIVNADNWDDWITSSTCINRSDQLCQGYYLEPEYPYPIDIDSNQYPIQITSDEGEFITKGTSTFTGNAIAKQGNNNIHANEIKIVHDEQSGELKSLHAKGQVKITEPNLRVDGSHADCFQQENRKIIYNSKYRLYPRHARGQSSSITIHDNNQKLDLPNASYTTCQPGNNTWHMKAKKVKLNKDSGRGEAWHSKLYLKDVPVFYWPYVNFPIDDRRQTGFLMPALHSSSSNGKTLTTPFYWNLAPNYDATITPNFMYKRNLKLDNNFRYLTNRSNGIINFNILPDDKAYQTFRRKNLPTATESKLAGLRNIKQRFSFASKHKTNFNKQTSLELEYYKVSDSNYVYDFGDDTKQASYLLSNNTLTSSNTTKPVYGISQLQQTYATTALPQKIQLQSSNNFGTATGRLEQYQTLHPFEGATTSETYRKLPELNFSSNKFQLFKFNKINWGFNGNYTEFKLRNISYETMRTTGSRYTFRPYIERPFTSLGWFVKPRAQMHTVSYRQLKLSATDLTQNKANHATVKIPIYDLDTGLIFERDTNIAKQAFKQTLEPRLYYLYIPKRKQDHLPSFDHGVNTFDYNQIFRDNKNSGSDLIANANQMGMGVTSKFLTEQTGDDKASVGVGRILYLKPNTENNYSITNKWSDAAAFAKYKINPYWNVETNVTREQWLRKTKMISYNLQYVPDNVHVVNMGYQFERRDGLIDALNRHNHLKQLVLSSAWEFKPQVRLLGKVNYDVNLSRVNNALFGVEKHSCCTIVRVVWMRIAKPGTNFSKKYENAVSLQLVLKGLAGTGNMTTGKVTSEIPGYTPNEGF